MKNLSITHQLKGENILIIVPAGHLDHLNSHELYDYYKECSDAKQCSSFIINLSRANYVGSKGFGVFMKLAAEILKQGDEMVIVEAQPPVLECFMVMNLERILKYFSTQEDGIEYFKLKASA